MTKWSLKEVQFVKDNFQKLGRKETAEKLNRPLLHVSSCFSNLRKKGFQINTQYYARKPFKFPSLTQFELGYLAGFFDGEGSINIDITWTKNDTPKYAHYMAMLQNKDPRPMEFIQKILRLPWHTRLSKANGLTYLCFSGQQRIKELLENLGPHLILKKEQAEVALQLIHQHQPRHYTLNDWKLVLKHAKINRADTHPSRTKRIEKLKSFIKELEK